MPGATYSPGDTQRPSTRPAKGARTMPSAIDFDTRLSWALVAATFWAAAVQLVVSRSYCDRVIAPLSRSAWARLHSSVASFSWAWAAAS
jgi:hypothetical protein